MLFRKKKSKKSVFCSNCQNSGNNCWIAEGNICVRYLPERNTNLTDIDGIIETPPGITHEMVDQMFINWIESLGWHFCGSFAPYKED